MGQTACSVRVQDGEAKGGVRRAQAAVARASRGLSSFASPLLVCALAVLAPACGESGGKEGESSQPERDAGATPEADGGDDTSSDAGLPARDGSVGEDASACACAHGSCVSTIDPESGEETRGCSCERGWTGAKCDACAVGYAGDDCGACAPNYFGSLTDPSACNPDPCVGDPCGGNGTCSLASDPTGIDVAACACFEGRDGELCASCADGYEGSDCEQCAPGYLRDDAGACVVGACANVECGTHGTCAERAGNGVCECEMGWTGPKCDACVGSYVLDQGNCVLGPCLGVDCGLGTCIAVTGVAACDCPRGYVGAGCTSCASGFVEVTSGATTTCANVLPIADRRLMAQFDAAAPGTFTLARDLVDAWDASRGDGLLWPESKLRRPRYVPLPPAVSFNGAQWMTSPRKTIRTGDNYTVFLVASWKPDGGRQTLLDSISLGADDFPEAFSLDALDENTVRFRHRGPSDAKSDAVVSKDFHANAGRQLIVLRRVPLGNSHVISLSNGTATVTAASPAGNFVGDVQTLVARCHGEAVGEFCPLDGSIHELLFYEGSLSGTQVESIEAYLRVKWSL